MAAHSPAASPRLPSPPPIAEDQLGPASPGVTLFEEHGKVPGNAVDTGASRRIRPGTKAGDMADGPPLVELQDIDSAFQLTEHLKALHYHHTHPPNTNTTTPITPDIAQLLARPPPNTSREIWLYELARFLVQKTNAIIVAFFADTPPCSPQSCPEMRASEWQYLCAVHDPPKSCAAIDYCCHTLDWAATTLTSSKMFPSRLGLGSGAAGGQTDKVLQLQMKEITNIFRRVYRIYAHAWFQHREMFWRVEGKTGLYGLFKRVCDEYGLIQAENYTIPGEAEGLEPAAEQRQARVAPQILGRSDEAGTQAQEPAGNTILAAGDTTKRHMHTTPDLSNSVSTVIQEEAEEEEDEEQTQPDLDVKPDLQRQATELRMFAESLPQPGQHAKTEAQREEPEDPAGEDTEGDDQDDEVADDNVEPGLGVKRSDTVKPPKEAVKQCDDDEDAEEGEGTAVEAETEVEAPEEAEVEAPEEAEAVELMEHKAAPAAEAEEAGKSVAD